MTTQQHRERVIDNLNAGILRDIAAKKIDVETCSDWMRERLADLIFHDPMLITVRQEGVVLTDAGREYLKAVDPQ